MKAKLSRPVQVLLATAKHKRQRGNACKLP